MLLFALIRLLFYFVNQPNDILNVLATEKLWAFRMGLEFDSCSLAWIFSLPTLILSVLFLFKSENKSASKFSLYSLLILFSIYLFIAVANIPYYAQFGSFFNKNALLWSDEPGFVVGMIFGSFSYWGFLILFLAFEIVFVFVSKKIINSYLNNTASQYNSKNYTRIVYVLSLVIICFFGIRGRTSFKSTLHEGLAIVGENLFINQLALNPNYTFWRSVFYKNNIDTYSIPTNITQLVDYTKKYLGCNTNSDLSLIRNENSDSARPSNNYNVVIVIMESMSVYKMGYYNGPNLTPNLHKLNKESVFCQNFFSSGIHTYNGLFSTVSGYPAIMAEQAMREYLKKPFNGIGSLLKKEGYDTYFYTTHDPYFDNMKGFFTLNGFDNFISQDNFKSGEAVSTLGVPDHVLFNKLIETHKKTTKPFLSVVMTASDHGPWVVPENISFKPSSKDEKDRCTQYADWAIGNFMENAKKQSWYNNTIFIFLGDHGLSLGHTYEMPLSYNHIPCIIHQKQLLKPDTIYSPAYQPDITATVMGLLNKPFVNETFGINILKDKHPFVFFSADDKIGAVDSNGFYYYDLKQTNISYLRRYKNLDSHNYKDEEKIIYNGLQIGVKSVFETAKYLVRKNYYSK